MDIDGTLANSEVYYIDSMKKCLIENNFKGSLDIVKENELVGCDNDTYYNFISKNLGISLEESIKLINQFWLTNVFDYSDYLFPETFEVIKELKRRGYKLAVCSNNDTKRVEGFMSLGFAKYFDAAVYNEKYPDCKTKPYPDLFNKAMELLDVTPEECVVVEDSTVGVEAGIRSGAYVIGTRECGFDVDLSKAHKIINNLIELIWE